MAEAATPRGSHAQNGSIWIDDHVGDWDEARLPLMSDAVLRSLSVFDGILCRRLPDGRLALVAGEEHVDRLIRGCRALGLPMEHSRQHILNSCIAIAEIEATSAGAKWIYVRPMVVGASLSSSAKRASLTIAAFAQDDVTSSADTSVALQTSPWRRSPGDSLSAGIKAVSNYQLSRLGRLQAVDAGFDDALFLNSEGRVAESAGAAILIETGGRIVTPPAAEDCLPSITIDVLERIADALGQSFVRRPVSFAELHQSEGAALAGTLAQVVRVRRVDHVELPESERISVLRQAYVSALAGGELADELRDYATRLE